MSEQDNIGIVKQAYENFTSGNIPALLALMSDDITWQLPEMEGVPIGGKFNGPAGVGRFFDLVGANQESLRFEPGATIAQGDKVASLGFYQWRVKDTDREFSSDFCHVFTIRDGKITGFQEYMDTAAAANAYRKAMSA